MNPKDGNSGMEELLRLLADPHALAEHVKVLQAETSKHAEAHRLAVERLEEVRVAGANLEIRQAEAVRFDAELHLTAEQLKKRAQELDGRAAELVLQENAVNATSQAAAESTRMMAQDVDRREALLKRNISAFEKEKSAAEAEAAARNDVLTAREADVERRGAELTEKLDQLRGIVHK